MATSAVPAAINALLTILGAAPALSAVRIVDGPPGVNLTDRHRLYVGWSPGGERAAAIEQDFAYVGARRRDENFTIACYLETRSGDTDMSLHRTVAFQLLGGIEDALRATDGAPTAPTLNGTVLWAHLTAAGLIQEQNGSGAMAGIPFTISCRARI